LTSLAPIKLSHPATRQFWEIPVLHEDAQVLALDKPADLPASPLRENPEAPSLLGLLHAAIRAQAPWTVARGFRSVSRVHRVDEEMSGVLLLARNRAALADLANQFGSEAVQLVCLALVHGSPAEDAFTVELRLAPDASAPGRLRADPQGGRRSITRFQVIERYAGYALVRCEPLTHRVHQIRAHLRSRRIPVVGDVAYGGSLLLLSRLKPDYRFKKHRDELPLIRRPALHIEALTVRHPATGQPLALASPRPKDLNVAVKYLHRYAPAAGRPAAAGS
jgi:RluA family pseudouridine synthase